MTFKTIQDRVLSAGFAEGKRAEAKDWIIGRHAWLWDAEEWTFRYSAPSAITFTANSQIANLGSVTDFRAGVAVFDAQGAPLRPIRDFREFFSAYNTNLNLGSGQPEAWTVLGGQIYVGPNGDGSSGLLVYEKNKPALVNDADTTGLPDGYDLALIHGGKAEGFKLTNVPLWQGFDDDFNAAVNALRRNYLNAVRAAGSQQLGAYRPGSRTRQWG